MVGFWLIELVGTQTGRRIFQTVISNDDESTARLALEKEREKLVRAGHENVRVESMHYLEQDKCPMYF
jgi:hypothetical protein